MRPTPGRFIGLPVGRSLNSAISLPFIAFFRKEMQMGSVLVKDVPFVVYVNTVTFYLPIFEWAILDFLN
jgi:hypothetical protein